MTYLSTSYRSADTIDTILRDIGENSPIRRVELSGGTSYTPDLLSTLREYKREYGYMYLLHNYFPPPEESFVLNIADADDENRRRSIEFAKRSIHWSAELGAPHYTVHAGYPETLTVTEDSEQFRPEDPATTPASIDEARRRFRDAIGELLAVAKRHDIKFGVENLFPASRLNATPLLCDPEEMSALLREFTDESAFGLLLDIGHLNVAADALGFDTESAIESLLAEHKGQILELHASYNRGSSDDHNHVPVDSWMSQWITDPRLRVAPLTYEPRGYSLEEVLDNMEQNGIV